MLILFLRDVIGFGLFDWLDGKRIIAYILLNQDLQTLALWVIAVIQIKRWNRIKQK